MTPVRIAAIVEGDGDKLAVPVLVKRCARLSSPDLAIVVDPVIRQPASRLVRPGELERFVDLAARKLRDQPALAASFDLEKAASACPSFGKWRREIARLVEAVRRLPSKASE